MRTILTLLVCLCLSLPAWAQRGTSNIDVITFRDSAGTLIRNFAAPFDFKCGAGATCTASGRTLTLVPSGAPWSGLSNPTGNLSLTMAAYTSLFTYNAATGVSNLFRLTDTASNTGTGYLFQVDTAALSNANPFRFCARGTTNCISMGTTGAVTFVVPPLFPAGTAAAPGVAFGVANLGIYDSAALGVGTGLGFVTGGVYRFGMYDTGGDSWFSSQASHLMLGVGGNPALHAVSSALIGLGHSATPSYQLSLSGQASRTIGMERHTTADTAGSTLTLTAGGATLGATNKAGGNTTIQSGVGTGSALGSQILFQTPTPVGAGTGDQTGPTTRLTIDNLAATFVPPLNLTVALGTTYGGLGAALNAAAAGTYPKSDGGTPAVYAASTLAASGVGACAANQWASTLNGDAAPTCTQPGFSNLSGAITAAQFGTTLLPQFAGVGVGIPATSGKVDAADVTSLAAESLADTADFSQATWTAAAEFAVAGTFATYTFAATGAGTVTQAAGDLATAGVGNRWYALTYVISAGPTQAGGTMTLTTAFASAATTLPLTAGSHTVYFQSKTAPTDVVFSVTGVTSGSFTIESASLKQITGGDVIANGKFTGGGTDGLAIDSSGNGVIDGTMTATGGFVGTVTKPANNTDNYVPQWNGANSGTLKDGLPAVATSTASSVMTRDANADTAARDMTLRRVKANGGTTLEAGDYALSAGWGDGPATIGSLSGTDAGALFTVTSAGVGQLADPTITLTFKNGTWTTAPICQSKMQGVGGAPAGVFTDVTDVASATQLVITFRGTPVAGSTYSFSFVCH